MSGEGLPIVNNSKERGDLLMNFNIEFPVYLPMSSKNHVKKAFKVSRATDSTEDTAYIHRFILADKMRRNVDEDIPLRRNPNDEQNKIIC